MRSSDNDVSTKRFSGKDVLPEFEGANKGLLGHKACNGYKQDCEIVDRLNAAGEKPLAFVVKTPRLGR